nr:hypothetical protein [Acetobacter persici]
MAKETKVGNGGLPHHFPNKTGLPDGLFMREMYMLRQDMLASQQKDLAVSGRRASVLA